MSDQALTSRYLSAKKALFDQKYAFLNEQQREAVFTTKGPLLVLAGAGTGKTTLLVNRIAYILKYGNAYFSPNVPVGVSEESITEMEQAKHSAAEDLDRYLESFADRSEPIAPWNILSITFTNKAANEMKTRLEKILGEDMTKEIWCGTFHSMCLRILRKYAYVVGYNSHFTIYDTDDSKKLIADCMEQLGVDEKNIPLRTVMQRISMAKNTLMTPQDFDAEVGQNEKIQKISSVYTFYQQRMMDAQAMDFDDIIMQTVLLLRKSPAALEYYQRQFRYVLVDEFQDTNFAQFELALLLSGGHNNLMVVGDDDQSIYKFRGATIENILHFDEKLPGTKIIKLEENYRSTEHILNAANSVIRHNNGRRGKELWSKKGAGEKVIVKQCETQREEAIFIVNKILELKTRKKRNYSDFAILYRTNAQSQAIENILVKSVVPYRIIGGHKFYDRKEIKDILAYLSVVNNPNDNLRLERIINEPKRKIGAATIAAVRRLADERALRERRHVGMFEIMENAEKYPSVSKSYNKFVLFVALIRRLQDLLTKEKLSFVVRQTIELSGYMDMLRAAEENGESSERRENVEELITVAMEYEQRAEEPTLQGFLEEIALFTDIDNYNEQADAVTLMTIHSAKGLEFPVVFLPGMEEGLFPGQQSVLSADELEEERRLAYVALTRAQTSAFAIYAKERILFGRPQHNLKSRFLDEIAPEHKTEYLLEQRPRYQADMTAQDRSKKPQLNPHFTAKPTLGNQENKATKAETLVAGDRVLHGEFGRGFGKGTVISVKEMGSVIRCEIEFDEVGRKLLNATKAPLKKI